MAVVVTGMGWISALGDSPRQHWQRLLKGETAIALRQPFPGLGPRPLAMLADQPQQLTPLMLRATQAALADAKLAAPLPDAGVVIGSSRGQQAQWEGFMGGEPLRDWWGSLPNGAAIAVARYLQAEGPLQVPMAACATGLWAIAQGSDLIRQGYCDRVIVGAGEAAITPLTLAGFQQMGALAKTGCYPFDRDREGLALGEGAVVLVLERETLARQRSAPIYGALLGAGLSADAHHISAPDPHRGGGVNAIAQCLTRSGLTADTVDFIHAHGTGTQLNDAYETTLIQTRFDHPVAVIATKGATGHPLGASGAFGMAVCLLALRHQVLPPCVGLTTPAFDLNVVRQPTARPVTTGLCFSFGFGGQNAVVAVAAPPC
jgi:3-oxoacyl-[acyl-carrier-protein] synthase II